MSKKKEKEVLVEAAPEKKEVKPRDPFKKVGKTKLIKGSILNPENAGLRFILSTNNLSGTLDNPLLKLFEKKWKKVREDTRGWYATRTGAYKFGAIYNTAVQSDVWVIHMLCQSFDEKTKTVSEDKKGLEECLKAVCKLAKYENATVHVSTLLFDVLPNLQQLLLDKLVEENVNVYFYQEP